MNITPAPGMVLVRPVLASEERAAEIQKRSGLLIPKPDNKHSFEGVPNQGIIYAIDPNYTGELKVGARVVFDEKAPKGFKWDDFTLFPLKIEQIVAEIAKND